LPDLDCCQAADQSVQIRPGLGTTSIKRFYLVENYLKKAQMKKANKLSILLMLLVTGSAVLLAPGCTKDSKSDDSPINDTTHHDTSSLVIPAGWSKVGNLNANNMIWSITSDGAGTIYAGGSFTNGSGYNYVARWDGTSWSDIGLKANSSIYCLTHDTHGNVYAVGDFTNGAVPSGGNRYVARWDGSAWSDIGQSRSNVILTADNAGNVYNGSSKWNGSAWYDFSIQSPEMNGSILAMASTSSGDLQYAGGNFTHPSGYRYVAKWNGSSWTELGSLNANGDILALAVQGSNVYAAGSFTNGNLPGTGHKYVAKWDGVTWSELGNLNANGDISSFAIDNNTGYVYASGYFTDSGGKYYVAKWDGTSWSNLGDMALAPTPIFVNASGKLYSVVAGHTGILFCVVVHN
jgi:hypothetical protein